MDRAELNEAADDLTLFGLLALGLLDAWWITIPLDVHSCNLPKHTTQKGVRSVCGTIFHIPVRGQICCCRVTFRSSARHYSTWHGHG